MFPYTIKKDPLTGEEYIEVPFKGNLLLKTPLLNKGVSFTPEERMHLGLLGALPHSIGTIESQARRNYYNFTREVDDLRKLWRLRDRYDLILTFRYAKRYGSARIFVSWVYNNLLRRLFRTSYRDISCGLRLIRKEVADELPLRSSSRRDRYMVR